MDWKSRRTSERTQLTVGRESNPPRKASVFGFRSLEGLAAGCGGCAGGRRYSTTTTYQPGAIPVSVNRGTATKVGAVVSESRVTIKEARSKLRKWVV